MNFPETREWNHVVYRLRTVFNQSPHQDAKMAARIEAWLLRKDGRRARVVCKGDSHAAVYVAEKQ